MLKRGPQLKHIVSMDSILYGELAQEKQLYYAKKRSLAQTNSVNRQHTGWRSSSRKAPHTILQIRPQLKHIVSVDSMLYGELAQENNPILCYKNVCKWNLMCLILNQDACKDIAFEWSSSKETVYRGILDSKEKANKECSKIPQRVGKTKRPMKTQQTLLHDPEHNAIGFRGRWMSNICHIYRSHILVLLS